MEKSLGSGRRPVGESATSLLLLEAIDTWRLELYLFNRNSNLRQGMKAKTMKNAFYLTIIAALMSTLVMGCSSKEYGYVTGVVSINGEPVQGAVVTFAPEGGGRSAFGKTGADGVYELDYTPGVKGAKIGPNRVSIATYMAPTLDDDRKVVDPGSPERFPPEYNVNPTEVREVESGSNQFDFDVQTTQDSFPRRQD